MSCRRKTAEMDALGFRHLNHQDRRRRLRLLRQSPRARRTIGILTCLHVRNFELTLVDSTSPLHSLVVSQLFPFLPFQFFQCNFRCVYRILPHNGTVLLPLEFKVIISILFGEIYCSGFNGVMSRAEFLIKLQEDRKTKKSIKKGKKLEKFPKFY